MKTNKTKILIELETTENGGYKLITDIDTTNEQLEIIRNTLMNETIKTNIQTIIALKYITSTDKDIQTKVDNTKN